MGNTHFILPLLLLLLNVITILGQQSSDIFTDQSTLFTLKAYITHDPQNLLQTNWSSAVSVCNWIGVSCGFKHSRVIAVNLSSMGLIGTIPPHVGNLSFLVGLDIENNSFHGTLPVELANLHRLRFLNFHSNNFGGTIPSSLGNLSKLEYLLLSYNHLQGQIPTTIENLSNLKDLRMGSNELSGTLPSTLSKLSKLKHLTVYLNKLSGQIPRELGNLSNLKVLFLDFNDLSGLLPNLPTSLQGIGVSSNKLVGEIPISICNMCFLQFLYLADNNLSGTIPECLRNITSLSFVGLSRNNFHGIVSTKIFPKHCPLRSFSIGSNKIEGPIPQSLLNCKNLEVLDVGNNNLEGTFPSWLGKFKNLRVLVLRSNRFYGHFSSSQNFFSSLQIIDLSHNNFSGCLPKDFFENLQSLMSNIENERKGEGAKHMKFRNGIVYYSVSLTTKGQELQFERILVNLMFIDFSSNQFSGDIPEKVGELHLLIGLNFSHNSLTGLIPSSLGNMPMLESLDLSSNKFQGIIPAELTNLGFLEVLNFSNNDLTGPIPQSKQFDTFTNESYLGNDGLCGSPLSKSCKQDQHSKPPPEISDDEDELDWRFSILMGYGCGLVLGLSMGYIVFTKGKPWWIVRTVEKLQQKYIRRGKTCRSGGRK